jgi:hypothetical protein
MRDLTPYAERLAAAVEIHLEGSLGPRRMTDLVARLKPLLDEARRDNEPWSRINAALSDELLRHGRQPISDATLRKLWKRVSNRSLLAEGSPTAMDLPAAGRVNRSSTALPKPHPSSVLALNHRSSGRAGVGSQAQGQRLALMRKLNQNGDLP